MRYGSVCSGIEAATLAWHHLGWEPVFFSEIESFPSAVLAHHYPSVPNLGDFTTITKDSYHGSIDLLVGGTPCNSFSMAGQRRGLEDPRGDLALQFVRLARDAGARWVVWENVPGVLSSADGRDFRVLIQAFTQGGYSIAYRVLDAQYTRVPQFPRAIPQRRRRLFLVGYCGDWTIPAKVLFDGEMCGGDSTPRRCIWQDSASYAQGCTREHLYFDIRSKEHCSDAVFPTIKNSDHKGGLGVCTMFYENHAQDSRCTSIDSSMVITARAGTGGNNLPLVQECICINAEDSTGPTVGCGGFANACRAKATQCVCTHTSVRKLLPTEVEALFGMPRNYTQIPYRGKSAEQCPDSLRYKAL